MALTLLFVTLIVLLIIGVPVALSLGLASLVYILIDGLPNVILAHNMINGIDSFPLLAIPFFILAGHLMNTAGITTKIFAFARAMVGCRCTTNSSTILHVLNNCDAVKAA